MMAGTNFNDQPYLTRRGFIAGLMAMPAAAAIPGVPENPGAIIVTETNSDYFFRVLTAAADAREHMRSELRREYGHWEGVRWVIT